MFLFKNAILIFTDFGSKQKRQSKPLACFLSIWEQPLSSKENPHVSVFISGPWLTGEAKKALL